MQQFNSIRRIGPGHPVLPVAPVRKEKDDDEKERRRDERNRRDDDEEKPLIDERV